MLNRPRPHPSFLVAGIAAVSLLGVGAVGCDALTDPDYPGEPILTLQGEVESALRASDDVETDGLKVAIVWASGSVDNDRPIPVAETTTVRGEFPANFTLSVFHPPAEEELVQLDDGVTLGLGFIVALPADAATGEAVNLEEMIGVTDQHAIVYIPDAAARDAAVSDSPVLFGVEIGFNLINIEGDTPASEACRADAVDAIDNCHANCDETCDPDGDEDPGCEQCREPCEAPELVDDLRACDALRDIVVPATTRLELVLDPSSVENSTVWSLFGLSSASSDCPDNDCTVDDDDLQPGDDI